MNKEQLFEKLWVDYTTKNPHAKRIHDLFSARGERVLNDHIAFRTLEDACVNIDVLSKPFIDAGYVEKDSYEFEQKKLRARHYELPGDDEAPLVFISELKSSEFSTYLQDVMQQIVLRIPASIRESKDMIFSGNSWGLPSYEVYEKLRVESEYAAWFYVNGFTVNHFTVSVNQLKTLHDIREVNTFLKENGYLINDAGGEVQGSSAELLEQSSVKAPLQQVQFQEGLYNVPGCYYEFAHRYHDSDGKLYRRFIAKSADKIFQSTDFYQSK